MASSRHHPPPRSRSGRKPGPATSWLQSACFRSSHVNSDRRLHKSVRPWSGSRASGHWPCGSSPTPVCGTYKARPGKPSRGADLTAHPGGVRLGPTIHLQRLLHLARRDPGHVRRSYPASASRPTLPFSSRGGPRTLPGLARRACDSSGSSWIPSPAASPVRSIPGVTSALRTSKYTRLPASGV